MDAKYLVVFAFGYGVYLLIGAGIFFMIERPIEKRLCDEAKVFRQSLLNNTWWCLNASGNEISHIVQVQCKLCTCFQ